MSAVERPMLWIASTREIGDEMELAPWGLGRTREEALDAALASLMHDIGFDREFAAQNGDKETEWLDAKERAHNEAHTHFYANPKRWSFEGEVVEWQLSQIEKPNWMHFDPKD